VGDAYRVNTSDGNSTNSTWGTSGLHGSAFFCEQTYPDRVNAAIVGAAGVFSANVAAAHYAGLGFYFLPDIGTNACAFSGISFVTRRCLLCRPVSLKPFN
jgi:hypothetical protein